MTLKGRIALVTGGAKGNGKGIVAELGKEGATVCILSHKGMLQETVDEMQGKGYDVAGYEVDVREKAAMKKVVDEIAAKYGKIDILVNNAGVLKYEAFTEISDESRDWQFDVNINGVWNATQIVIPYMIEKKYGRIINLSSVTGEYVCDPGSVTYATSKAAIVGFTKGIAMEYAKQGITCNALCPGWIRTPMVENYAAGERPEDPEGLMAELGAGLPIGRMGTPKDIGNLVAFFAKEESEFITGATIVIDGGSILPES